MTRARESEHDPGRAALVGLKHRYLGGLLDPFVTLLEVHKLMYFMQVAGESLRLQYLKAPFGPYAENLRHILALDRRIHGLGLCGRRGRSQQATGTCARRNEGCGRLLKTTLRLRHALIRWRILWPGSKRHSGWSCWRQSIGSSRTSPSRQRRMLSRAPMPGTIAKKRFSQRQIALAVDVLGKKGWIDHPVGHGR